MTKFMAFTNLARFGGTARGAFGDAPARALAWWV
jgi:hypothetical protein